MRLYLSSHKFGNRPEELVQLAGPKKHAGIILNASDTITENERNLVLQKQVKRLADLGFTSEEIDLRQYFNRTDELKKFLHKFQLIWVRGGNIFLLQRAFEQSGFNKIIKEMLDADKLVYASESAGSVIVGPSLNGLDIVDDPKVVPSKYTDIQFPTSGVSLINYMIVPHYDSNHSESKSIDKLIEYLKSTSIPYKTLKDGEVIIIDGNSERILV
jgi:dipeptidase E